MKAHDPARLTPERHAAEKVQRPRRRADERGTVSGHMLTIAVVVAAAMLAFAVAGTRSPDDDPSSSFCQIYPRIDDMVAMLERGLEGEPEPDDLPVSNYQDLRRLVWSNDVAQSGPAALDDDAVLIASAVRRAAAAEDAAPLQSAEVRRAVSQVRPAAADACQSLGG